MHQIILNLFPVHDEFTKIQISISLVGKELIEKLKTILFKKNLCYK